MWQATLPKGPSSQTPAARGPGKGQIHGSRGFSAQAFGQPQFQSRGAQETLQWPHQQAFASAVYQSEFHLMIEGENRQIDFFDDGAKQPSSFHCAQALLSQHRAERIDLDHHFTHSIIRSSATGANREIFFTHGCQQVGQSLQRKHHPVSHRKREAEPQAKDQKRQCPCGPRRVRSCPQQNKGNERAGKTCSERQKLNAAFVSEAPHPNSCFCNRRYSALRLSPSALAAWLTLPSWRASVRLIRWRSTSSRGISSSRAAAVDA